MTSSLPAIKSEEKECETLYAGSKHFWKNRCHVDFNVMWHKKPYNVIEIAAFNVDKHLECPRIFCDTEKLFEMVNKDEVEAKVRAKQEEMMRQRKPRMLSEELAKTIVAQMAMHVLIQRALVIADENLPDGIEFLIEITAQTGDKVGPDGKLECITTAPEDFIETDLKRRKKATTKEFKQTLASFKKDSQKLTADCNKAARKAGLAKSAVAAFASCTRRYTYDSETMSAAKIRWLKAGRKIIILNTVRKITDQLNRLERKSMGELPSPVKMEFKLPEQPAFMQSISLPSLEEMPSQGRNRRVSRPHQRLKPVRAATRKSIAVPEEEMDL